MVYQAESAENLACPSLLPNTATRAVSLDAARSHIFDVADADGSLRPIGKVRPFGARGTPKTCSGHARPAHLCTALPHCMHPPATIPVPSSPSLQVKAINVAGGWGLARLRLKEAMAALRERKPLLIGDLEVGGWLRGWLGGGWLGAGAGWVGPRPAHASWVAAQACLPRHCWSQGVQRGSPCGMGGGPHCAPPCAPQAGTGYAEAWPVRPAWWADAWGREEGFEEEQQRLRAA